MKNYRKLVPVVLAVLLIVSWYLLISEKVEINSEYQMYLAQARHAAEDGLTKEAMANYNKALEIKSSVEVYAEVAEYYKEYGKPRTYLDWCERFLETYPTEILAYESILTAYVEQEDYESCYDIMYVAKKRNLQSDYLDAIWNELEYHYTLSFNTYEDVSVYSNNFCAVKNKGYWGYVDRYGKQRVNCIYPEVSSYTKSNYTSVVTKDGDTYYIDKTGSKVAVMDDKYIKLGLYVDNCIAAQREDGKYDYIDNEGELVFGGYDYASTMNGGIAAIKEGDNWYIIDSTGVKISDVAYEDIKLDEKEIAFRNDRLFVKKKNSKYIMIDATGTQVGTGQYDDVRLFATSTDLYTAVKIGNKWSYIDKEGNVVSKQTYSDARPFSNGLAAVKVAGKWGFIDENEEMVIDAAFYDAKDFNEKGSCFVMVGDEWQLLKLYRLNREG